mgnify:CR=1 FL=1
MAGKPGGDDGPAVPVFEIGQDALLVELVPGLPAGIADIEIDSLLGDQIPGLLDLFHLRGQHGQIMIDPAQNALLVFLQFHRSVPQNPVDGIRQLTEFDPPRCQLLLAHELRNGKDDGPFARFVALGDGLDPFGVQGGLVGAEPGRIGLIEEVDAEEFRFADEAAAEGSATVSNDRPAAV